jgi:arylsulfatase A-like enzyme
MVMLGPGIIPGTSTDAMTSTIDLAPTVTELIGGRTPMWTDGRSLVPFIRNGGQAPADWRTGVLTQSLGESRPGDPDYEPFAPPIFNALRTPQWLFTNYQTGERELYDLRNDPFEQVNIVRTANPVLLAQLQTQLDALSVCRGETCRIADRILPQEVADSVTPPQLPDVADLTTREGVVALER